MRNLLSVLLLCSSILMGCGQKSDKPIWEVIPGASQDSRLILEKTSGCLWAVAPQKQNVNPDDLLKLPATQAQELVKGMNEFDETAGRYGRFELVLVKGIQPSTCEPLLKKGQK